MLDVWVTDVVEHQHSAHGQIPGARRERIRRLLAPGGPPVVVRAAVTDGTQPFSADLAAGLHAVVVVPAARVDGTGLHVGRVVPARISAAEPAHLVTGKKPVPAVE